MYPLNRCSSSKAPTPVPRTQPRGSEGRSNRLRLGGRLRARSALGEVHGFLPLTGSGSRVFDLQEVGAVESRDGATGGGCDDFVDFIFPLSPGKFCGLFVQKAE
jgi:hypothetical protein